MFFVVATGSREQCHRERAINLQTDSGYLSSITSYKHGFGSASCPWSVAVKAGQLVELSYINTMDRGDNNMMGGQSVSTFLEF